MRTKIQSPCLGCSDRQSGCHGKCELYQAYKKAAEEEKENNKRSKDAFLSYAAERKRRRER